MWSRCAEQQSVMLRPPTFFPHAMAKLPGLLARLPYNASRIPQFSVLFTTIYFVRSRTFNHRFGCSYRHSVSRCPQPAPSGARLYHCDSPLKTRRRSRSIWSYGGIYILVVTATASNQFFLQFYLSLRLDSILSTLWSSVTAHEANPITLRVISFFW